VEVWDVAAEKRIKMMRCRSRRVGALVWNRDVVSSGINDGRILEHDVRMSSLAADRRLVGHHGEVSMK
jgi:deoxycytidylate deaminase